MDRLISGMTDHNARHMERFRAESTAWPSNPSRWRLTGPSSPTSRRWTNGARLEDLSADDDAFLDHKAEAFFAMRQEAMSRRI